MDRPSIETVCHKAECRRRPPITESSTNSLHYFPKRSFFVIIPVSLTPPTRSKATDHDQNNALVLWKCRSGALLTAHTVKRCPYRSTMRVSSKPSNSTRPEPASSTRPEPASAGSWSDTLKLRIPEKLACPIEPFLNKVTERVIESLHETAKNRLAAARGAAVDTAKSQEQSGQASSLQEDASAKKEKLTPQQQIERASFLAALTADSLHNAPRGDRNPGPGEFEKQPAAEERMSNPHLPAIRSIIRGYLVDFLRQTEEQIVPCNILDGKLDTSAQRAYWEKQPSAKFWSAAGSGVFHSAFSYNKLCEFAAAQRSVAWSALANIVKTSAEKFKEMHLEAFSGVEPQASVLNDHQKVLQIAIRHERPQRPGLPRAS